MPEPISTSSDSSMSRSCPCRPASRSARDRRKLVKATNAFLASLETSGEGQALYDKWLGKDSELKATRKFEFGKPQETWFTN